MSIKNNLDYVIKTIDDTIKESGRNKKDVKLICVSKTKPIKDLKEAYDYGIRDFGENKVQELLEKYENLPKDIRWHMIGHLQRNKVKYIVDKVSLIHSVDSLRLAKEIDKEAKKKGVTVDILLEVNIGMEESKDGYVVEDLYEDMEELFKLENIKIKGLMCVPPYCSREEESEPYFLKMGNLLLDIKTKLGDNIRDFNNLSMGMSGDYKIAIRLGATYIRVGSIIFGERVYR